MKYCTYLTFYRGNKLPPFYIGFSTIDKIGKGYHGSVSSKEYKTTWKQELIDNPHLFETKIISVHEEMMDAQMKEVYFQRHFRVTSNPLYANKAIGHVPDNRGKTFSPEHREKLAIRKRGRTFKHSEETRQKMRHPHKKRRFTTRVYGPMSEESKRKLSLSKREAHVRKMLHS